MKILGHQKIWNFLKNASQIGKVSHAYLFSGQEKLGKKTLALEFTKLLNCHSPNFSKRPCQICSSCQAIGKGLYPDLLLILPIDQEIKISQIRDLIYHLSLKPHSASFKVAIIDQCHLMNQEAQNCFLKTLEEPKGNTILILITEYPNFLLPTILSRCEIIKFYPVKKEEIRNFLKEKGISKEKIEEISEISLGRPGLAIDFISIPKKLEDQEKILKGLLEISDSDLATRFQYARNLSHQDNLKEILDIWLNYFRNILISKLNGKNYQKYSFQKLKNILQEIQKTNFLISTTNINQRLALEILMMEL